MTGIPHHLNLKIIKVSIEQLWQGLTPNLTINTIWFEPHLSIYIAYIDIKKKFRWILSPEFNSNDIWKNFVLFEIIPTLNELFILRGFQFEGFRFAPKMFFGSYVQKTDFNAILKSFPFPYRMFSSTNLTIVDRIINNFINKKHFISFIPFFKPLVYRRMIIKKMAIIVPQKQDLMYAYEEGLYLFHQLKDRINVDFFTLPISPETLDNIFSQYTLIHYAGHSNDKGLKINNNEYFISFSAEKKECKFLFLSSCFGSQEILQNFYALGIVNILYFQNEILDQQNSPNKILDFYKGLLLGFPIGNLVPIIEYKKKGLIGWNIAQFNHIV